MQRSGLDSRRYQIFWEVVGLERGPLSLVSTIVGLLARKSSGFCLEIREYGCRGFAALTTRYPLSAKVGTNVAVARSVSFPPVQTVSSYAICCPVPWSAVYLETLQIASVSYDLQQNIRSSVFWDITPCRPWKSPPSPRWKNRWSTKRTSSRHRGEFLAKLKFLHNYRSLLCIPLERS
jgi:hypothetical protein